MGCGFYWQCVAEVVAFAVPLPALRATLSPGEGIGASVVDGLADSGKLPGHFQVCEAQNCEALGCEISGALPVFFLLGGVIVLRAIQLHHKLCLMAVEIRNVISNDILPAEAHRVFL